MVSTYNNGIVPICLYVSYVVSILALGECIYHMALTYMLYITFMAVPILHKIYSNLLCFAHILPVAQQLGAVPQTRNSILVLETPLILATLLWILHSGLFYYLFIYYLICLKHRKGSACTRVLP